MVDRCVVWSGGAKVFELVSVCMFLQVWLRKKFEDRRER